MNLVNRKDDGVVQSLIKRFLSRSAKGIDTYGMTLEQNRMPIRDWNLYLQEELMDASLYLEKLRSVHEDTDESIKKMSKKIRDMQTVTDSLRESLEKMMDDALGTDLQPEIVDLLKATKNNVENTEWQLELAHTLLNSKYMRILNMPSS
jgi:predicted  nucleic acid-binding Zn-ribbon protein